MKTSKLKFLKQLFLALFPSPLAYVNFMLLIAFVLALIMMSRAEDLHGVLIAGLGSGYFLNEWSKETKK